MRQLYGPVGNVATIPTGIDLSAFAGLDRSWLRGRFAIPAGAPVVIHVGRLAREKNVHMLMQALRRLLEELPALHAVVAGGGPFLAGMRAATSEPPFAGRLHLTGPLAPSEVPRHLAGADLFLTASTTETQGLVAVEAMAAGLPVVAPEAGGIPDVVRSGQDGLLVTARPEALAEAARGLLEQPHRLRRLAEHALARSREFGVEHTVSRLEQLYQRLKSAHASGAGQG
ncbi:MAG: glycosyltransferase [Limnochordaceae bacterium]|nr:glycosyltransferase [Limnochordaceae bacterium]